MNQKHPHTPLTSLRTAAGAQVHCHHPVLPSLNTKGTTARHFGPSSAAAAGAPGEGAHGEHTGTAAPGAAQPDIAIPNPARRRHPKPDLLNMGFQLPGGARRRRGFRATLRNEDADLRRGR